MNPPPERCPAPPGLAQAAVCLLGIALFANPGHAHTRSLSYSSWRFDGAQAEVSIRLPRIELTRLGALGAGSPRDPALGAYLATHLRLRSHGGPCAPVAAPAPRHANSGWAAFHWQLRCPNPNALVIESDILLAVAPSHLHFARVDRAKAGTSLRVLSRDDPRWVLDADTGTDAIAEPGAASTSVLEFAKLGVKHILGGWDHLAFVLALILLARTAGEVARLVTGFTLAHSLTLALSVVGALRPDPAAVESVIAFSVVLVAAENTWLLSDRDRRLPRAVLGGLAVLAALAAAGIGSLRVATLGGLALFSACHFGMLARVRRPAGLRGALAFAFGLVHGFGFAGILAEMALPTDRLAPALFGFNAGVEVGQLGVVALCWPALRALARSGDGARYRLVAALTSAAICGIGIFWLAVRTLG